MRALALVFLLPGLVARGATIAGSVDVRRVPSTPELRPTVGALTTPYPPAQVDRRRSVVYLEVAPQAAFDLPERPPAVLDQHHESFDPYVVAITAGSSVLFPNHDITYHNVFSLSKAKRFDLGRYPSGATKSVRFDRPGVVRVFCDIHSHMSAFILVFAHPYFAVTDSDGRYRVEGVPPGDYQLSVWNDGETRATHKLHVPATDAALEENFVLP
jgi:plastocyanin